jgi:HK97 family phage major capsid protein
MATETAAKFPAEFAIINMRAGLKDVDRRSSNFPSFHALATAVMHAEEGPPDRRLQKFYAAASGSPSNEGTGADGGYIVPPEFLGFMRSVIAEESLAGLCTGRTTTSSAINVPTDAEAPWASAGLALERQAEAASLVQGKAVLENRMCALHKLDILVPCSEELLEDAIGFETYFQQTFRDRATFRVNDWLLNGTGVGMPTGLLSSPALVVQTKESGPQAADTIVLANLAKMLGKLYSPSRSRAVWVFSPSAWTYVEQNFSGPAGAVALDYSGDRAKLLGRPVYVTDAAQLVGDQGDVVLFDPSAVLVATKPGGTKFDLSVGLWFDQGLQAYRASFRIGLLPLWSVAVNAYRGSASHSTVVALESR